MSLRLPLDRCPLGDWPRRCRRLRLPFLPVLRPPLVRCPLGDWPRRCSRLSPPILPLGVWTLPWPGGVQRRRHTLSRKHMGSLSGLLKQHGRLVTGRPVPLLVR
eukprot:7183136-Heterocapsa_arctica.AAC.1